MKAFECGDVVPGCRARWVCMDEDEMLREVAKHAASEHGFGSLPADIADAVRSAIVDVA